MIYQPEVRLLISIPFHCCQGAIDGAEDASKGDIVRWQGKDVVMETMIM